MDLTDILFSKPFIGGSGGGSGSNVKTGTIEITVTDGTPTITSGAFPEWCTGANSEHIYGEINLENVYINGEGASGRLVVYEVISNGEKEAVLGGNKVGNKLVVAKDLSYVGAYGNTPATSGTLTINLIYMPEENSGGESGGGESGGGTVETATIEITVTDGTPTITSGEFPEWCIKNNNKYILGKSYWDDVGGHLAEHVEAIFKRVEKIEETQIVTFIDNSNMYGVATDLSLIARGTDIPTPLTGDWIINITLIYMPEENSGGESDGDNHEEA